MNIMKEESKPTNHIVHEDSSTDIKECSIHEKWNVKQGLQLKGLRSSFFENCTSVRYLF